jgi:hypothetical protein
MSTNQTTLVIEAGRTERHYWRDLWRYRELFYLLASREAVELLPNVMTMPRGEVACPGLYSIKP